MSYLSISYRSNSSILFVEERNKWIRVRDKYPCGRNNKFSIAWETYRKTSTSNFVIFIRPSGRNEQLLCTKPYDDKSGTNSMYDQFVPFAYKVCIQTTSRPCTGWVKIPFINFGGVCLKDQPNKSSDTKTLSSSEQSPIRIRIFHLAAISRKGDYLVNHGIVTAILRHWLFLIWSAGPLEWRVTMMSPRYISSTL